MGLKKRLFILKFKKVEKQENNSDIDMIY